MGERLSFPRQALEGDVLTAARALLGARLVSDVDGGQVVVRLTEVEAYAGTTDPASHAWRGVTPRTAVMAGPAGHAYVYFSYGMHWCLNVSAGPDGTPAAVLLRAGTVVAGSEVVAARRVGIAPRDWARGPGRLTRTLGVDSRHGGLDLCAPAAALRLLPATSVADPSIRTGPRVGVSRAADRPWRFWLAGDSVSAYKRSPRAQPLSDSDP